MNAGRNPAVALALLLAALLATAGCSLGPGDEVGNASLTVTRDFGAEQVVPTSDDDLVESDTVMRMLERGADIETRYGGGFVQAIDGLEADAGAAAGPSDWFFFVDGIESSVGAADYPLDGAAAIWWDYRNWKAAMRVPAVVGSWPAPFADGYEGRARPVAVECRGAPADACETVRDEIAATGARLVAGATPPDAIRVLVGAWALVAEDPAAAAIADGPQKSGVYAEAGSSPGRFEALDEQGRPARALGPRAGLIAAVRRLEDPPTWVVTGAGVAGVRAAAEALDADHLRDHYAIAVEGDEEIPLPLR